MHIANPIYDTIFKYMLEDNKVAKIFISAIIGEEILELDFNPQEYSTEVASAAKGSITVCRFDFSAKIKTEASFKTVIIELQKAKYSSDLMRFRRYLGLSYQNKENSYDTNQEKARQIYCIYFLDYGADLPARPVLKVDYKMEDVYTGDEFPATGEFVSGLHHRSWIVQIQQLKQRRRNDLEKLLGIFDQSNITDTNHILNVEEDSFPEEFQQIIRRLRKAAEDPGKRRSMDLEDDIVKELQGLERKIEEKDKAIEEKDKTLAENQKTLAEKDKTLAEKDKTLAEKEREIAELKRLYGIKL